MNVMVHDFTKPTRLPVERRNRLTAWCRVALTLANKSWAKQLPAPLEALVQDLDLCHAGQALARLPDESLVYKIKLGDRVTSILVVPRTLMLRVVGLLLGDNSVVRDRELTLIEDRLGDYFLVNHWLAFFRESWPGPSSVAWVLDGRETNLPCSRIFTDTEVLLAMHWRLRGSWGESPIEWYFPKAGLLDLLGSPQGLPAETIPEAQVASRREAIVQSLSLSVEILFGSAELRLSELSSLQVGDVVLLDQRTTDGVRARAGDQDLFRGRAGKVGGWKAFQVETSVKK